MNLPLENSIGRPISCIGLIFIVVKLSRVEMGQGTGLTTIFSQNIIPGFGRPVARKVSLLSFSMSSLNHSLIMKKDII